MSLLCNVISPLSPTGNSNNKKNGAASSIDNKKSNLYHDLTSEELNEAKQTKLILHPKQDDFVMIETVWHLRFF